MTDAVEKCKAKMRKERLDMKSSQDSCLHSESSRKDGGQSGLTQDTWRSMPQFFIFKGRVLTIWLDRYEIGKASVQYNGCEHPSGQILWACVSTLVLISCTEGKEARKKNTIVFLLNLLIFGSLDLF